MMSMPSESQKTERLQWIENAKGVGVLSVIMVHSMIPDVNPVTIHLSSFTIPLFFVMAGLTYNNERHRGALREFIESRGRRYMIPYFVLYVVELCLRGILGPYAGTELPTDQILFWLAYGSGPSGASTHLWFLPVLFFGLVLFAITDRVMMRAPHYSKWLIAMLFLLVASYIQSFFRPALVPWHMNAILISAAFIIAGNEMRQVIGLSSIDLGSSAKNLIGVVAISVILLTISAMNGFTDIAVDNTGTSVWLYLATGIIGSVLVFILADISQSVYIFRQMLTRIGRHSQEVYEIHPVMFYIIPIVFALIGREGIYPADYVLLWPARFFIGVSISLLVVERVISRHRLTRLIFSGSSSPRT